MTAKELCKRLSSRHNFSGQEGILADILEYFGNHVEYDLDSIWMQYVSCWDRSYPPRVANLKKMGSKKNIDIKTYYRCIRCQIILEQHGICPECHRIDLEMILSYQELKTVPPFCENIENEISWTRILNELVDSKTKI